MVISPKNDVKQRLFHPCECDIGVIQAEIFGLLEAALPTG